MNEQNEINGDREEEYREAQWSAEHDARHAAERIDAAEGAPVVTLTDADIEGWHELWRKGQGGAAID